MVFSLGNCDLLISHRWPPVPHPFCRVSSHPYRIGNLNSCGSLQVRLFSRLAPVDPLLDWFRHTRPFRQRLLLLGFTLPPLPVPDFRQVFEELVDVLLVLHQIVFEFWTIVCLSIDWQGIQHPLAIATRPHTQIPGIA